MRNVILYIAMSLDGYIAGPDGDISWLEGDTPDFAGDCGYSEFIKTISTVIMGYKTYEQIACQLFPGAWPYSDLESYVITHRDIKDTDQIKFVSEPPVSLVEKLKFTEGRDIWICGGASIIQPLLQAQIIDEYHITIIPRLVGGGIRLFYAEHDIFKLRLYSIYEENGMVSLVYKNGRP